MNPQDPFRQTPTPPTSPSGGSLPPLDPSLYAQTPAPQPTNLPEQPQPFVQPTQPAPAYQSSSQTNDYNVDYLNSIAPNQQKVASKFAVFGLIGGVIIAAIFGVLLLSAPKGSTTSTLIPPIAARIETLKSLTASQQKRLNENQISETNAALNSALATMNTDIQKIIEDQKLTKAQTKQQIADEEAYSTELTTVLEKAYQRGTLDRTYAAQMTYDLTILESQITALKKTSKNEAVQTFCNNATSNIQLVLSSYESFDASKQ